MSQLQRIGFTALVAWMMFLILIVVLREPLVTSVRNIYSLIKNTLSNGTNQDMPSCNYLTASAFHPATLKFVKAIPHFACGNGHISVVYLQGNLLKINESVLKEAFNDTEFIGCRYKSLQRNPESDFKVIINYTSDLFTNFTQLMPTDENIVVECFVPDKQISVEYFNLIRKDKPLGEGNWERYIKHTQLYNPNETLSLILLGVDATSRQNFQRAMPETRNFLLNTLNAFEFKKHSVIGYGTYPNVIAVLTGMSESEVMKTYGLYSPNVPYDNVSFIWKTFKNAGYRTHMSLDGYDITAFHWQKTGFLKNPTDYTNRPLVLEAYNRGKTYEEKIACFGSRPNTVHHLNYLTEMASVFNNSKTPYFAYTFLASLTHDDMNRAHAGDIMYYNFFKNLHKQGFLHNTVVIFFSDHGLRWGSFRETYNGMIEEREPFLYMILPWWFQAKYPEIWKFLGSNQEQLTSPFDLYATMIDILYFETASAYVFFPSKGTSLLRKMYEGRGCEEAGIGLHYCMCRSVANFSVSSDITKFLAVTLMNKLESIMWPIRDKCVLLRLHRVVSVYLITHKLGDSARVYRVTVVAVENQGMYEGTVKVDTKDGSLTGKVIEVNRINLYRGQADCVADSKLMPFCLCRGTAPK